MMLTSERREVVDSFANVDGVVTHMSPDGDLKEGDREPGDIILIEYCKVLTFFEIDERGTAQYKTSMSRM